MKLTTLVAVAVVLGAAQPLSAQAKDKVPQGPGRGCGRGRAIHRKPLIKVTEKAFDDFAGSATDRGRNRRVLGLEPGADRGAR